MSAVIYNYKVLQGRKHPLITLGIFHNRKWMPTEAYADSGAFYSVFGSKTAECIRLEYQRGRRENVKVGSGGIIPIYLNEVRLQTGRHRIKAVPGFSDKLGTFNLLGRRDIFSCFKVCFDERNLQVVFCPYEDS
jgi:hypothetical protein